MSIINVKIIWKIYVLAMNFITCSEYVRDKLRKLQYFQ